MHKVLVFVALTLFAAFSAGAQPSAGVAPCAAPAGPGATECCGGAPPVMPECPITDCVGAGAALPVASPDQGHASRTSDSTVTLTARLVVQAPRAPDTAPPKSLV